MLDYQILILKLNVQAFSVFTGESEGLYFDEYLQQEQDDCMDVMDWVSDQPWSTGKVSSISNITYQVQ